METIGQIHRDLVIWMSTSIKESFMIETERRHSNGLTVEVD